MVAPAVGLVLVGVPEDNLTRCHSAIHGNRPKNRLNKIAAKLAKFRFRFREAWRVNMLNIASRRRRGTWRVLNMPAVIHG